MSKNKYTQEMLDKLDNSKEIFIENRKITKEDLEKLGDYEYISTTHNKGFGIMARKQYQVELFCNMPVLMFSVDKYVASDELFGKHDIQWTAEDCAEYINGLLGYE